MWPFVGTEAVAAGKLTRGELRWNHTAIHPNIYLPNGARRTVSTYAAAAWLWTGRQGIVAGPAAAALHGVNWIAGDTPIDLIGKHRRRQAGVTIRDERIADDEITTVANLPVTTAARTALDLARRLPHDSAIAHLDALAAVTGVTPAEVFDLADRYSGMRGIRQARDCIELMDGGAQSPRATWLRLLLMKTGLPRPQTNITVEDRHWATTIAIGWTGPKVGVDIEDEPVTDPYRAVQEVARSELLQRLGWFHIVVVPKHPPRSIVYRVRTALSQHRAI